MKENNRHSGPQGPIHPDEEERYERENNRRREDRSSGFEDSNEQGESIESQQKHRDHDHHDYYYDTPADVLEREFQWLEKVIETRLLIDFDQETEYRSVRQIRPPYIGHSTTPYAKLLREFNANTEERIILLLALVPHIRPDLLNVLLTKNTQYDIHYPEFGGVKKDEFQGFKPTIETAFYVLSGRNLHHRFRVSEHFESDNFLQQECVIRLIKSDEQTSGNARQIEIYEDWLENIISGKQRTQVFNEDFPAKLISTDLNWQDVVLSEETKEQIQEVSDWILHGDILLNQWDMKGRVSPGYLSLFYGPPGTGKTLMATMLGKLTQREVYRIDLSSVVSKYIGETEKNLDRIFNKAENKDWILFFDEADALFGKRTGVNDSHDRYANQEVSYLLQRIEKFNGVIILASNKRANMDEAFARRFHSIIHFPIPEEKERLHLWQNSFSKETILAPNVNLEELAEQHELTGATIMNVVRYASLKAIKANTNVIKLDDIETAIAREFYKEGKSF